MNERARSLVRVCVCGRANVNGALALMYVCFCVLSNDLIRGRTALRRLVREHLFTHVEARVCGNKLSDLIPTILTLQPVVSRQAGKHTHTHTTSTGWWGAARGEARTQTESGVVH